MMRVDSSVATIVPSLNVVYLPAVMLNGACPTTREQALRMACGEVRLFPPLCVNRRIRGGSVPRAIRPARK
jgi:hypothetical protein